MVGLYGQLLSNLFSEKTGEKWLTILALEDRMAASFPVTLFPTYCVCPDKAVLLGRLRGFSISCPTWIYKAGRCINLKLYILNTGNVREIVHSFEIM